MSEAIVCCERTVWPRREAVCCESIAPVKRRPSNPELPDIRSYVRLVAGHSQDVPGELLLR